MDDLDSFSKEHLRDSDDDDVTSRRGRLNAYDDGIREADVVEVVSLRCRDDLRPGQYKCGMPVRRAFIFFFFTVTWFRNKTKHRIDPKLD